MGRIQISDDALYKRELLKKIVKEAKHLVVAEATTGDEAIDLYRKVKLDLVLLDIVMPAGKSPLNGMEALKRILEGDPSANVVIYSAVGQQVLIEEALRLGAKDFIAKPIMPERILEALSKYC
jgi:two-component system, chemotaxis family, chemotaxis protein CheY